MKKFTPPTTFMNSEIIYTDQNIYLNQAVNMFISAVKFHILTWGSMGIDSLLQPAPSGHSRNCSLWHFLIVFTAQHGSLPLDWGHGRLAKYSPNARMCSCSAHFIEDASGVDLGTSIPECITRTTNQLLLSFIHSPTSTPTSFFPPLAFYM